MRDKETKGRANHTQGSANSNAKLDDQKVRHIRAFYADGVVQTKLARMFGVSQLLVSRIVRRQSWQHIR